MGSLFNGDQINRINDRNHIKQIKQINQKDQTDHKVKDKDLTPSPSYCFAEAVDSSNQSIENGQDQLDGVIKTGTLRERDLFLQIPFYS